MATARMTPSKSKSLALMQRNMAAYLGQTMDDIGDRVMGDVRRNLSGIVLHVRSGRLRSNVQKNVDIGRDEVKLRVGTDLSIVPYARIHELGGWTGKGHKTKIPKRPYLRTAFTANKEFIRKKLEGFVARLTRLH